MFASCSRPTGPEPAPAGTADPVAGENPSGRTLILGLGNRQAGDDGFGSGVLRLLQAESLPAGVELADGNVLGVDLLSEIADYERLILVDAIRPAEDSGMDKAGGRDLELETGRSRHWVGRPGPVPGEVVVFRLGEVELEDPDPRFSLHDLSFGGCLRLARLLDLKLPEISVVGFILPSLSSLDAPGLSPEACRAVPAAAAAVRSLLSRV